jgi:hypothetical protein
MAEKIIRMGWIMSQQKNGKKEENQVVIEKKQEENGVPSELSDGAGLGKIEMIAGQNDAGWD